MAVRKNTLWRLPVFCFLAGVVVFHISVYAYMFFAMETLPENVITMNEIRVFIIDALLFFGTLFLGGRMFFRKMTRRELFWSATILAVFGLVTLLLQLTLDMTTSTGAIWMYYLFQPFEWCNFSYSIVQKLTGNIWIGIVMRILTPYLFVLFGRKEGADA